MSIQLIIKHLETHNDIMALEALSVFKSLEKTLIIKTELIRTYNEKVGEKLLLKFLQD
jgi:hypothetical protein